MGNNSCCWYVLIACHLTHISRFNISSYQPFHYSFVSAILAFPHMSHFSIPTPLLAQCNILNSLCIQSYRRRFITALSSSSYIVPSPVVPDLSLNLLPCPSLLLKTSTPFFFHSYFSTALYDSTIFLFYHSPPFSSSSSCCFHD